MLSRHFIMMKGVLRPQKNVKKYRKNRIKSVNQSWLKNACAFHKLISMVWILPYLTGVYFKNSNY